MVSALAGFGGGGSKPCSLTLLVAVDLSDRWHGGRVLVCPIGNPVEDLSKDAFSVVDCFGAEGEWCGLVSGPGEAILRTAEPGYQEEADVGHGFGCLDEGVAGSCGGEVEAHVRCEGERVGGAVHG